MRVQEEPNCTRLFYEELPNVRRKRLAWPEFKKLAKIVGLPAGLSKNIIRQLTDKTSSDLSHYWEQSRGR
jgi:hypothetical protein